MESMRPTSTLTPEEKREVRRLRSLKWYYDNKETYAARRRAWRANPESNENRKPSPPRTESHRKMRERRAGRARPELCELCGRAPTGQGKILAFDHCHTTGKFRGWLCNKCNTAIGLAGEDPAILRALADYLEAH